MFTNLSNTNNSNNNINSGNNNMETNEHHHHQQQHELMKSDDNRMDDEPMLTDQLTQQHIHHEKLENLTSLGNDQAWHKAGGEDDNNGHHQFNDIERQIMETTQNLIDQTVAQTMNEQQHGTTTVQYIHPDDLAGHLTKIEPNNPHDQQQNGGQFAQLTTVGQHQQTAIIDPNNPENVVIILTAGSTAVDTTKGTVVDQSGNDDGGLSSLMDVNQSGADGLDQDDSNLEDANDTSLKDIDDTLAMSPGGGLGGGSASFILNGNNVSTHTFRKTEWDVKKLENYVRLSFGDATPMENMDPALMNRYLKSFFELAKKSDGMDYEPESLIGFMNSFERYLKTKNYPESLLRSETFKESRTVLKKKRDLVRSIGKLIRTKTKDTCYLLQFHRNLLKEKGLLNRDNPDCLLAEIYLNNMIYFGEFLKEDKAWRGNLNLVWGDMILERDPQNGVEYLTLATYAKKTTRNQNNQPGQPRTTTRTKTGTQTSKLRAAVAAAAAAAANPSANLSSDLNSPRVYARQPPMYCPIEAYKNYRSRRPNNCLERDSPFYLAPLFKSKNQSKTWYKALAMSCQRLDALFYCLFKKAGVDLTSLASMSAQQQQQVVAAAASMDPSTPQVGTYQPTATTSSEATSGHNATGSSSSHHHHHWNKSSKQTVASSLNDVNDLLGGSSAAQAQATSSGYKHLIDATNTYNQTTSQVSAQATPLTATPIVAGQQQQQQQSQQPNVTYYATTAQTASGHHIITTVPAQVQVQVQIQVQLAQHQKQHHLHHATEPHTSNSISFN